MNPTKSRSTTPRTFATFPLHDLCVDHLCPSPAGASRDCHPVGIASMKLSEMRQMLDAGEIQLSKSLGQNFLHDQNLLQKIAQAAALTPTDKVLEIGPGLGPLTECLLAAAGEVLAIEKDERLVRILQARLGQNKRLTLRHDDALAYLRDQARDWSGWKLAANLPYSVASPILVELAEANGCPERLVATLQLEVAHRLFAQPDRKDYGVLTLLLQLRYEPRELFKIPAACFFPAPEVDSACVTLVRRPHPLLPPAQAKTFTKIVKRAFSQRRKMMLKLLKQDWPADHLAKALAELKISPQERGEKLSLHQFVALTQRLAGKNDNTS